MNLDVKARLVLVVTFVVGITGSALAQPYCIDEQQRAYQPGGFTCTSVGKAVCKNGKWELQSSCNPQDPARGAGIVGTMRNGTLIRPDPNERIPLDPVTPNRIVIGPVNPPDQAAANSGPLISSGGASRVGIGVTNRPTCHTAKGSCEVSRAGPCQCRTPDGRNTYVGTAN